MSEPLEEYMNEVRAGKRPNPYDTSSKQPQPWTPQWLSEMFALATPVWSQYEKICELHNAALAAFKDNCKWEWDAALAAEREQHKKDIGALIEGNTAKILAKDEQLVAERAKFNATHTEIKDLKQQLAAERKRADSRTLELEAMAGRYNRDIAAEREQAKKLQTLTEDNQIRWMQRSEQLEQQLAALVDALEKLPEQLLENQKSNPAWSKSELWGIERDIVPALRALIANALAKVNLTETKKGDQ